MKIMEFVVYNVVWAEAYLPTKWHLDTSSRLATRDMGQKEGGLLCPLGGRAGSPSNTIWPWAEAYLRTKWNNDPSRRLATADMDEKLGRGCVLFGGAAMGSHLIQCGQGRDLPP